MNMNILLPFLVFFPMAGGIVGYMIGRKNKKARDYFACIVTGIILIGCLALYNKNMAFSIANFCGLGIQFKGDGLRVVLAVLTAFIWFMTTVFSREYFAHYQNRNRYYLFMLLSLGATLGVFLSADFYTTFIFFEMMSFTSYVLVIHEESDTAIRAAQTYLAVAVIGGLVTLMGLFMLYSMTGTLQMDLVAEAVQQTANKKPFYAVGVLVLFGFGAKAGMFPLHIWLPEAHPVAPAPASALLSCILTKTGVYGILVLSCMIFLHDAQWGMLILVLGVITMVLGAVLAVFSVNLKRTLACSSLSQIGFILVATGMQGLLGEHNALAAAGTLLHLVNHSLLKLVLFMAAGVVFMNLHELNLNKIRGFGRKKPLLNGIFLMGVLGITGVPFWNGYISKTLIHESIVEYIELLAHAGQSVAFFRIVEILFIFSGGLTVAYMVKIYMAVFVEKNTYDVNHTGPYMNKLTAVVLTVSAALLPILGLFPHTTLDKIADMGRPFMSSGAPAHVVHYFSMVNLKGGIISIIIGIFVYLLFIRKVLMQKDENGNLMYVDCWPKGLSLENKVYRPVLLKILPFVGAFFARVAGSLVDGIVALIRAFIFNNDHGKVIPMEDAYFSVYTHEAGEKGVFREGVAKSLLFFGLGVAVAMLYMLF